MTQEAFIKVLNKEKYSYEIEGDKVVVTHKGDVVLNYLTSLPPGVEFRNRGYVGLKSLTSIPPGVAFGNDGIVNLQSLTSIHPVVEFNNEGDVWLADIIGNWFKYWKGNIEGIDPKRLLNLMISKGVLER